MSKVLQAFIEYTYSGNLNNFIDKLFYIDISVKDIKSLEPYGFEPIITIIQNVTLNEEVIDYLMHHKHFDYFIKHLIQYQLLSPFFLEHFFDSCISSSHIEEVYTKQKLSKITIDFCIKNQLALDALLLHQDLSKRQIKNLIQKLDHNIDDFRIEWIINSLPKNYYPVLLTHEYKLVREIAKSLLNS